MIDKSVIDPNALQFYRMLKEAGFSAYFVGGAVRDLLLGKSPKDFDIATNATPHQIKRIIPQGRIIGRRFRHVMLEKQGGRYEIVTFRGPVVEAEEEQAELDDEALEDQPISTPDDREDSAPPAAAAGSDRGPRKNFPDLNQFGTAEQDAKRRDFTINALFYDPDADELVDYVEGKLDIDRKLIRSIGESQQRMEEDPIRILRAIRHKMKLGLEYDIALETAMRDKAPLLEQTSKDRIREEFLKVCNDHSLGAFLSESRRLGLVPHIMPWFEGIPEDSWNSGMKLWDQLKTFPIPERASADLGLSLMMVPLVSPLVLEPYKATLKESEKNYLPDMKYFLSCEPLRNFYLRNLRISRAQTDHIVRTLFYFSRMNGLWLEQGPPRRIVGRLFQHPPALLAAKMAKIALDIEGKVTPPWILELADFDPSQRRGGRGRDDREGRDHDRPRGREEHRGRGGRDAHARREAEHAQEGEEIQQAEGEEGSEQPISARRPRVEGPGRDNREEREPREHREPREPREPKVSRLPPPDHPMIWNGPLHAPVLRPNFNEEQAIRWARKNQTVRAYRPSGIPNQPTNLLKTDLVYNYKPELESTGQRSQEDSGERSDRGPDRGPDRGGRGRERERGGRGRERDRGGRGRGRDRGPDRGPDRGNDRPNIEARGERPEPVDRPLGHEDLPPSQPVERVSRPIPVPRNDHIHDEDSIGNMRRPGEAPAALADLEVPYEESDDDSIDDDIGNRLDAPPTSGHVGMNGEGVLGRQGGGGRGGQHGRGGGGGQGRGGPGGGGQGGGGGGGQGGARRRGRRRGRRGGGGGPTNRGAPRSSHNNP